eukprot:969371-Prymnesium_polylepis.1
MLEARRGGVAPGKRPGKVPKQAPWRVRVVRVRVPRARVWCVRICAHSRAWRSPPCGGRVRAARAAVAPP